MIIIDYILGGHYVPACPKCFIRIVSFNLHLKRGGEYSSSIHCMKKLRLREDKEALPRSHSQTTAGGLHFFIHQLVTECLQWVLGTDDVAVNKKKSSAS